MPYSVVHRCGVEWCILVFGTPTMATKKQAKAPAAKGKPRLSVSFPADLKRTLEQIAEDQKVSLSWVVRDAAEKYVSDRWPLLAKRG